MLLCLFQLLWRWWSCSSCHVGVAPSATCPAFGHPAPTWPRAVGAQVPWQKAEHGAPAQVAEARTTTGSDNPTFCRSADSTVVIGAKATEHAAPSAEARGTQASALTTTEATTHDTIKGATAQDDVEQRSSSAATAQRSSRAAAAQRSSSGAATRQALQAGQAAAHDSSWCAKLC